MTATKRFGAPALIGLFVAGLLLPAVGAGAKPAKTVVVGKDDAGDWGVNGPTADNSLSQVGDFLGMDLIEASIGMADTKMVNFIIKVNSLPPMGGMPEISRYIWSLSVGKEYVELDGKFTNYSRGACDPTAGSCPPPRNPGQAPFLVRGNCETNDANITTCQEIGLVNATFVQAEGTITIPVPLEMIGAKPGTKITAGASDFTTQAGGTVIAIPSVFLSRTDMPADALQMTGKFAVPKK